MGGKNNVEFEFIYLILYPVLIAATCCVTILG